MSWPELPAVPHVRFPNPPLRAMLGQAQFPTILRLEKGIEAVADFQDSIRSVFPSFSIDQQVQVVLSASGDIEPTTSRASSYRFTNQEGTWSAILAPNALTLEAVAGGRYSSYEEFASLFRLLWSEVVRIIEPSSVSRQGLRYVDHFEGERTPEEWTAFINPELLGALAGPVFGSGLERSVSEYTYSRDGTRFVFRNGIVEAGPQRAKGYLLDFDFAYEDSIAADDTELIMSRFDEAHDFLYRFFRWCVTDRSVDEFNHVAD